MQNLLKIKKKNLLCQPKLSQTSNDIDRVITKTNFIRE